MFIIPSLLSVLAVFDARSGFIKHTAVITDIEWSGAYDDEYSIEFVEYNINGEVYNERIDLWYLFTGIGDKVTIYYDHENPHKIIVGGMEYFGFLFMAIGAVFIIGVFKNAHLLGIRR